MAEHWQGGGHALNSTLQLLRSGREALVAPNPPTRLLFQLWRKHSEQREPAPQQQMQQLLDPAAASSWLAEADLIVHGIEPGPSYPALRRGVVVLLLHAWLAAGERWSQSDGAAGMRILRQLYVLHRLAAARKSAVEYYHFSKAAGTSVCTTSAEVGCTTFSTTEQFTCLVPAFGDGPRWIHRKAHDRRCAKALPDYAKCKTSIYSKLAKWGSRYGRSSPTQCRKRAAYLAHNGYNFYASEYTLRGRDGDPAGPPALCGQFLNLAVLRSPRARLASHVRYVVRLTHHWLANRTATFFAGMRLADWRALLPAVLDNYYARALLGEAGFYAPGGGLTASEHLPAARAVLSAMDVILFLEDANSTQHLGHKWGLGWDRTFLEAEGRSSGEVPAEVAQIADEVLPTGADAEELAAANSLDEQLYDFAVLLSRLDAVVWAAAEATGEEALRGSLRIGGENGKGGRCGHVATVPPAL